VKKSGESKLFLGILAVAVVLVAIALYPTVYSEPTPPAPADAPLSGSDLLPAGTRYRGDPKAPYVLIEFGEYQCPTCALLVPHVDDLLAKHRAKVKYVFYFTTVEPEVHRHAARLSMACEAADQQGKFWEMHNAIFRKEERFTKAKDDEVVAIIKQTARELGLDVERLIGAMGSPEVGKAVERQIAVGRKAGVNATPCFYVVGSDNKPTLLGRFGGVEAWFKELASQK
jgi:protein-disulfide isomerase